MAFPPRALGTHRADDPPGRSSPLPAGNAALCTLPLEGSYGLTPRYMLFSKLLGVVADTPPPSFTPGVPRHISANRQNLRLSAGMPLLEGVGGPILPEACQDQNQKRKFAALLWHRIATSLVLRF